MHPESPREVVQAADGSGSTQYLWSAVQEAPAGSRLAIGTEGHFVRNARELGRQRGVEVMHLAAVPQNDLRVAGCGCATMSRNDPPHLAGMLDLRPKRHRDRYGRRKTRLVGRMRHYAPRKPGS